MRIIFIVFFALGIGILAAQNKLPVIQKWLDDSFYLENRMENLVSKTYKINVLSGKAFPYTERAKPVNELPDSLRNLAWGQSAEGKYIIKKNNDLYLFEGRLRPLTADATEEKVPQFSPNGKNIAYVKGGNLWIIDINTNLHKQLTLNGDADVYNGYASWVYFEEILGRSSRYRAYWWSPDSRRIAYLHTDDKPVPKFPVYRSEGNHGNLEMEHYPKSGDPNPLVHMEIVDLNTGSLTRIEEDTLADQYTAWPFWTPDSKQLIFQELNREQTHLRLYSFDTDKNSKTFLFDERYPTWVEFHEQLWFLKDNSFLIIHPLDGWWNIYKYDQSVKSLIQLTKFDWRINDILRVDESKNRILITGTGDNKLDNHLYSINLDGTNLKNLTPEEGIHRVDLSPGGGYFINTWSNLQTPRSMYLSSTEGKKIRELGALLDVNKIAGIRTEFFTVPSGDGFDLPVIWSLPSDFEAGKASGKVYPVIFSIYGGPDAGSLRNSYKDLTNDKLLNQGVILLSTDHRASGKFGKKGLDFMHRNLGKWEIHDYSAVAEWLKKQPFIDTAHIAIEGGSYGGYITALALTKAPNSFTHGISFAPVIDWSLYDNVYTERYMDTPQENPEGYKQGSVLSYTDQLRGKLYVVHGSADDNVHMQNTFQLIEKLQLTGKQFEMMIYPNVRHGWGGPRATHLNNLELDWWNKQNFMAKKPAPKS